MARRIVLRVPNDDFYSEDTGERLAKELRKLDFKYSWLNRKLLAVTLFDILRCNQTDVFLVAYVCHRHCTDLSKPATVYAGVAFSRTGAAFKAPVNSQYRRCPDELWTKVPTWSDGVEALINGLECYLRGTGDRSTIDAKIT